MTCRVAATLALLAVAFTLSPAGAARGPTGPWFRPVSESPSGAAEVLIGQAVVVRLRAPVDELSADDRALVVATRLASLLFHGLDPGDVFPAIAGSQVVVIAQSVPVVTVDEETARQQQVSCLDLALAWSNNLRRALGAPALDAQTEYGVASWYGPGFHGRRTASGEVFDQEAFTAAHRTLPFGTVAIVTRTDTGQSVAVRINDRGPWVPGRVIDLSRAAAKLIGLVGAGLADVRVTTWSVAEDGSP
ncbi:MAG: septal ring lytic transglycosylase RlpA family protein [bacterium]|nr:septal ring lytic transglycosylase RlpA family protein [bacterium]